MESNYSLSFKAKATKIDMDSRGDHPSISNIHGILPNMKSSVFMTLILD